MLLFEPVDSGDTIRQDRSGLAQDLRREAELAGGVVFVGGLTNSVVEALERRFIPTGQSSGHAAQDGRGSWNYWIDHGRSTGALMRHMTLQWGGHPELYERVGRVHDLDYLCFPHDVPKEQRGNGRAHPVPLVQAMRDLGVHPAVTLAILEHAPHVSRRDRPSSRLSATLQSAEDLTTIAALRPPFDNPDKLSKEAKALLAEVQVHEHIYRNGRVRVESDPERFVNTPLQLVISGGPFQFEV